MEVANQLSEEYCWVDELEDSPVLLVSGLMGSGKSSFVNWMLTRRREKGEGRLIEVCDPSAINGQWTGFGVFGRGSDYEGIDNRIEMFLDRVKHRCQKKFKNPDSCFHPLIFVCDEFYSYSDRCANVDPLLHLLSAWNLGKVRVSVVIIGQSQIVPIPLRSVATTLELMAVPDPRYGMSRRKFKGLLKTPTDERKRLVKIAPFMKP